MKLGMKAFGPNRMPPEQALSLLAVFASGPLYSEMYSVADGCL